MKLLFIIITLVFTLTVHADDTTFDVTLVSRHFQTDKQFNELNQGFGITHRFENYSLTAVSYENSYHNTSNYFAGGYSKRYGSTRFIETGVMVGILTGYDPDTILAILPVVSIGVRNVGKINLIISPKAGAAESSAVMFAVSFFL